MAAGGGKKKMGRPSKFETIDLEQLKMLAQSGWTDKKIADFFRITEQTLNNYKQKHPDFFESLKDWKSEADEKVERSLYERATGFSHPETKVFMFEGGIVKEDVTKHYPPDSTAAIFWLKNRKPEQWRDKHPDDGDGVQKIEIVRSKKVVDNGDDTD